ncbi:MAG: DUF2480 family protein [Sphingobacteriales bacterium]|jgi:hypothetical protein|nr:DUF2480 family protein [Sphingobacteriales bacterium]
MSEDLIENKVAASGLITIDLADFSAQVPIVELDIKPWLFRELILQEKSFREQVKAFDWSVFQDKIVAFTCSTDAIIPVWAYMLLGVSVQPYATRFFFGSTQIVEDILFTEAIARVDFEIYRDARVILKGCGDIRIPENAYVAFTAGLLPVVKSIMYGEACSNVPVFKRK